MEIPECGSNLTRAVAQEDESCSTLKDDLMEVGSWGAGRRDWRQKTGQEVTSVIHSISLRFTF